MIDSKHADKRKIADQVNKQRDLINELRVIETIRVRVGSQNSLLEDRFQRKCSELHEVVNGTKYNVEIGGIHGN